MAVRKLRNSWWVDFRFNHDRIRKRSPDNSQSGAKAYEATLRARLARGEEINKEMPRQDYSFEEFARQWFKDYVVSNNKFNEQRAKESILRNHLIPFFGRRSVGAITTHHVEQFKAQQVKNGVSLKTLRNHLTVLNKCLSSAHDWLNLDTPLPKITWPKCPPVQTDYLSPEECESLLANADGIDYEMILTTLRTGMRQGEIKGLQWPSIDWQTLSILVQHSHCDVRKVLDTPKSGRARHIPLDIDVAAILHKRKQTNGYVFLNSGKPFSNKAINLRLEEVCTKAKLRRVTWHILRHTFATHLAMKSVPLQTVQQLLGHSTVKTTERYAHVAPSMLRAAIDILNPKTELNQTFGQLVGNNWNHQHLTKVDNPAIEPQNT